MVSLHSHLAEIGAVRPIRFAATRKRPGSWLATLMILGGALLAARAAETNSLIAAWLGAQTNVHAWSADFVQTRTLKSLTQPLTATGRVWFAEPNRFHWEILQPQRTIAIRSGDEMWVVYPKLKRAERYPLNQAGQWRDALSLLEAGFPRSQADLEAQFRIVNQTTTNNVCDVTLQPKSAAARRLMPQVRIAFSTRDFLLRATELQWADGSTMRNDFTNAVLNPTVDASLFRPAVESDFKIVEPLKH